MDTVINTLGAVAAIGVLVGLIMGIKPFWVFRKRWQGWLLFGGCFFAVGLLQAVPVQRPASISEGAWADRVSVCKEAEELRDCPLSETQVAAARAKVAEARRKVQAQAAIKAAEEQADETERLARAKARELEATDAAGGAINDSTRQQSWIYATERAVKAKMRDPGSVRFRNSRFSAYQGKVPVVCGEVNAKNGFGGHTGFQRFIASGETFGPYLEEAMSPSEFAKSWNTLCGG